jgi:hypothetical protein
LYKNAPSAPRLLVQLQLTLQNYGNAHTYRGARIGGVVAGCPRGPAPSPLPLVYEARWILRQIKDGAHETLRHVR